MNTVLKWLLRVFLGVAGIALIGFAGTYFLMSRSLPDYSALHRVHGINGPVEIVRDGHAIPHVFGGTDEDVFFGLGFAHAQDRLWQMTMLRRAAYGRLSELFGPVTLQTDRLMRILDIHGLSVDALDVQDAETQAALHAYSQGVNAWMQFIENSSFNSGAPEFLFFDDTLRPWEPFDSIAILNLQAIDLAGHADDETLRARAANTVSLTRLKDLMPVDPSGGIALPFVGASAMNNGPSKNVGETAAENRISWFTRNGRAGASNVWAAAPSRTAGKASLLANDPHLAFSAPSIWMLARLEFSGGGVIGATIPGVPLIASGRSANIAWGITSSYVDTQDLYFERLDPESDKRYLTPDGGKEFRSRIDVIQVKGQPPERIELRWTDNGPVIPPEYFGLSQVLPRDHVTSLAWTLLNSDNPTMTAGLRLMKAKTVDEALEAGRLHRSPPLNILVADRTEIAMQMVGAAPRRHVLHETKGMAPSPGWKSRNRWLGELDYDSLPRFRNPLNGVLGNTNNKAVDRPFPDHLSMVWGDTQRFKRLEQLLAGRDIHTSDSFVSIQLDTLSYAATTLVPLFARDLWHRSGIAARDETARLRNAALNLLFGWDGDMSEHRPEPLIFAAWAWAVQKQLIQDDLGSLASEFRIPDPIFLERVFDNIDGAAAWCDIVHTGTVESCDEVSLLALDEAVSQLSEIYGDDVSAWRWGKCTPGPA